ncbi:MAG: hypothetical protein QXZ48_02395 [Zestosphaera sp.]
MSRHTREENRRENIEKVAIQEAKYLTKYEKLYKKIRRSSLLLEPQVS